MSYQIQDLKKFAPMSLFSRLVLLSLGGLTVYSAVFLVQNFLSPGNGLLDEVIARLSTITIFSWMISIFIFAFSLLPAYWRRHIRAPYVAYWLNEDGKIGFYLLWPKKVPKHNHELSGIVPPNSMVVLVPVRGWRRQGKLWWRGPHGFASEPAMLFRVRRTSAIDVWGNPTIASVRVIDDRGNEMVVDLPWIFNTLLPVAREMVLESSSLNTWHSFVGPSWQGVIQAQAEGLRKAEINCGVLREAYLRAREDHIVSLQSAIVEITVIAQSINNSSINRIRADLAEQLLKIQRSATSHQLSISATFEEKMASP